MRRRLLLAALWSLALSPALGAPGTVALAGDEPALPAAPAEPEDDPDRGRVGFAWGLAQALKPETKKEAGITQEKGLVVTDVVLNSPAQKAGLKVGDVIVKYNGQPVPDSSSVKSPDDVEPKKAYEKAFQALSKDIKPGDTVEIVVERDGKPVTLSAVAVTRDVLDEEALYDPVPDPAGAGAPTAAAFDFEGLPDGEYRPTGLLPYVGLWEVQEEEAKPENHGLLQNSASTPWALCIVTGPGRALADGKVSVRFKPLAGEEDASGGIAFRVKDRKNYYFARGNALENNLRLYVVQNGLRRELGSVDVPTPKMKEWHTLEVAFAGEKFTAVLDGKATVEGSDATFQSGWVALWTKADSETLFDDLKLEPTAAK